mmetsp:Transcript_29145/g.66881  ORF Transcript_29145/g.66881 Transcript_29145/m.66881 type:complete len:416 (+) Transcript_29145:44-1291(+)
MHNNRVIYKDGPGPPPSRDSSARAARVPQPSSAEPSSFVSLAISFLTANRLALDMVARPTPSTRSPSLSSASRFCAAARSSVLGPAPAFAPAADSRGNVGGALNGALLLRVGGVSGPLLRGVSPPPLAGVMLRSAWSTAAGPSSRTLRPIARCGLPATSSVASERTWPSAKGMAWSSLSERSSSRSSGAPPLASTCGMSARSARPFAERSRYVRLGMLTCLQPPRCSESSPSDASLFRRSTSVCSAGALRRAAGSRRKLFSERSTSCNCERKASGRAAGPSGSSSSSSRCTSMRLPLSLSLRSAGKRRSTSGSALSAFCAASSVRQCASCAHRSSSASSACSSPCACSSWPASSLTRLLPDTCTSDTASSAEAQPLGPLIIASWRNTAVGKRGSCLPDRSSTRSASVAREATERT